MKSRRLLLPVVSVCLLLAVSPARANPGRAVYMNEHNYKVFISSDGYITVSKGDSISGTFQPTVGGTYKSTYKVCRTYNKVPGESLAVFNDKIYYAYTADTPANYITFGQDNFSTSCSNPGHGMSVWVATFDPQGASPRVISNRALGAVAINYQTSSASGAAITVFNNQLYLFTDSGIYISSHEGNWSGPYPALETSHWEPLDAVTIYQGLYNRGPRMLIVYGNQTSSAYLYYSSLWGVTWNGNFDATKDYFPIGSPFPAGTQQQFLGSVSLSPGTAYHGDNSSAKEPAVQLFARAKVGSANVIQHIEFTYGTSLGQWRVDPTTYGTSVQDLFVYPYSSQDCGTPASNWDLRQYHFMDWNESSTAKYIKWTSDALVPQNRNIPIVNCGDTGGTETNTMEKDDNDPEVLKIRQHYWMLVGVILGGPPFAQNGYTAFTDYQWFSNVNYGTSSTTGVDNTNSMSNAIMVSAGGEIHAGVEGVAGVGVSIDMSYKHAWESSTHDTVTETLARTDFMGTQIAACRNLGKWGWALFEVPRLIYQDWKAYAWDYSPSTGTGSALNQDLHTIKVKEVAGDPGASFTSTSASFELADPGGPNDQYPGLLLGMKPFRSSLNTSFWYTPGYSWQGPDSRWVAKLGEGNLSPLQFGGDHANDETLSNNSQTVGPSTGHTDDISFKETASVSAGTKINGLSGYLSVGYAGSFKTSTAAITGFGSQLVFQEKMRDCNFETQDCVTYLTVQPYMLQPTSGDCDPANNTCAPWVPTAYRSQKPWAITWKVTDVTNATSTGGINIDAPTCPCMTNADCTVPPNTHCSIPTGSTGPGKCTTPPTGSVLSSNVATGIAGGRFGTSLPPANASGRVVSGMGGGVGGEPTSHYTIQGGRLAWFLDGAEERIPMTAGDFDPSKGVTVQIQELSWSLTPANGTWTRGGNVWTFQPNGNENRARMQIDFGAATYNLEIQKVDLSGRVPAGTTILRLLVTVNQQYKFYADVRHDIDIAWRWSRPAADAGTLHVTSIEGRYNTATEAGKASIAGTLPANLPAFGDVELNVNEHPYVAQLVGMDGFQQAMQSGGTFKYAKEGLILSFDFGGKTWSATFNDKAFHELLVPQVGMLRTRLSVGGLPWYQADDAVLDYSANLTLQK